MLSLTLLIQVNQVFLPLAQYAWQSEKERAEFCVNQEKVKLDCHGKCHRNSQVEKILQPENSSPRSLVVPIYTFAEIGALFLSRDSIQFFVDVQILTFYSQSSHYLSLIQEPLLPPPRSFFVA